MVLAFIAFLIYTSKYHDPPYFCCDAEQYWSSGRTFYPGGSPSLLSEDVPNWLPLPTAAIREASSVADLGLWYAIGEAWSHVAAAQLKTRSPHILDIGCGCGKMARFFALNPDATYLGIDVYRPAIQWCKQAFGHVAGFSFSHFDIHSPLYNRDGVLDVATTSVPAEDKSADLVICASLFTHLLEPAFRHYIGEVARCLSDDGVAVVSTHNQPQENSRFSGTETRIDIDDRYFEEIASSYRLSSTKIGKVFGQEVFALRPRV
jgi:SAM-dependent methyltransferase